MTLTKIAAAAALSAGLGMAGLGAGIAYADPGNGHGHGHGDWNWDDDHGPRDWRGPFYFGQPSACVQATGPFGYLSGSACV
ncbi:hypothetical protein [Mycolicibacterium vinylchloridicum]|uniref:hypothetical protein n=1 Tax=Mycolicibacterium vinylchloridicum TaxID=2736928 RepID=UPI0015C90804|nr:hypothetical protein [Mycolicibacterium vinylchloridicum]